MPTTPTSGRSTVLRISRRTSSRSVADDQPSTSTGLPRILPSESSTSVPMETDVVVEDGGDSHDLMEVMTEKIPKKPVDKRVSYICSILLTENRKIRDKLVMSCGPVRPDDEEEQAANALRIQPVIDQIQRVEQIILNGSVEDVLKDPRYAVIADLSKSIEPSPSSPAKQSSTSVGKFESSATTSSRAMQPIEVKIEDTYGVAGGSNTSVLQSASGGVETNVERAAKREAHVLARIAELRKNGLWSNSRLPKCVEPERNKTHWDFLLEEVKWMATDFRTEATSKRKLAKVIAHTIAKLHRDKKIEKEKAAEREIKEKRKMCAGIAKMIKDFWSGVDKVVDIRAKEILESRLRKARNKHLMFVIGQVDEMSNIVHEGLVSSKSPSISSHEDRNDKEFEAGSDSESDDEQTIANAEKSQKKEEVRKEVDALQTEATTDMDDFLYTLPPEYLKAYGLTQEDLDEMKREKQEEEKRRREAAAAATETEKIEVDENPVPSKDAQDDQEPSTSAEFTDKSSSSNSEEKEQLQDTSAEDGNGDGRGVLQNVDYVKLNSTDSGERQQELANIAEEALKFQPKGYTLETTQVKTPVPFLVRGQLREYQMVGLDWMVTLYEKNLNGILADEMGLGKTIQTISLLAHLACSESIWGPHLIVVPTSVILNWEMEFKKWCPALKILTYFGTAKERAEKRKGWMKANCFHVCITSYKTVTQDIRAFKQRAWQYLILDEAQNIKNWKSQRWQALLNVRARRRLLLTGTPLQNSLMELWSLMHFLMPTIFSSHDDFKDWFSNPLTGMMEGSMEFNAPLIGRLHKVLRPFILRRLKKEVEKQLPEKTEHVVRCSLSKRQRYLYDDFMSRRSTKENLKSGNMMSVLNIVMQLRKCCNHPNLFEPRPVVAPFVVSKIQMDMPARVFEIAQQDFSEDFEIPQIFNLSKIGYQSSSLGMTKKPLIEELEAMSTFSVPRPPQVNGFRFNRITFVAKNPQNEESEDEGVMRTIVEDRQPNGTAQPLQNGNSSVPSSSSSRPHTSFIRSKTVMNPAPLTITTNHTGFHFNMANLERSRLVDNNCLSPPLKRAKLTGAAVNWADYVPQNFLDKVEASRKNQLEIVRRRFASVRTPIVPLEMVALVREEIMTQFPRLAMESDEKVQEGLLNHVELLVDRFGMYVEPVLTDAWQCRPSSSGLPSYIRENISKIESDSRSFLLKFSTSLDIKMSITRALQFPELRLIEYDCGKLQTLAILLRQLYLYKHRCLIFTQMSKMLDVLQTFLSHHGYQYFRLDGTTGVEQRQAMMERFNADPKIFCFILSTRSGGVGVNLTGADTVIFYDSDWNPTMDAQAQDRCHRIGQTRNVSIYRLISERTIEENILRKAQQKKRLGELAIDEAGFTPEFFKQSDNIRDLFEGENVDVAAPKDVPMSEKEIETALAKCEDEADVNAAKIAAAEARVDNAEFDERAPPTSNLPGDDEADEKYMELIQQLKPIERYAIGLLETQYKPEFEEECKEAEALIDQKREEWDKNLNETAVMDPDDMLNIENNDINDVFYQSSSLLDEVRDRRRKQPKSAKNTMLSSSKSAKKVHLAPRARSPSKRKSQPISFDPYISYAPRALASPPDSPRKRAPRGSVGGSAVGGGTRRVGRPPKSATLAVRRVFVKNEDVESEDDVEDNMADDVYAGDIGDINDHEDVKTKRKTKTVKRKKVAFVEPNVQKETTREPRRRAASTPKPLPASRVSHNIESGPISPSSLTTLPQQGPLISLPTRSTSSSISPVTAGSPGPSRLARVVYQQRHSSLLPVRIMKTGQPSVGSPGRIPPLQTVPRRTVPGIGAGGVGRLPIIRLPTGGVRLSTGLPGTLSGGARQPVGLSALSRVHPGSSIPTRNGVGGTPARQFVVPTRMRIVTSSNNKAIGPTITTGASPTKLMFPVRVVQRPVVSPGPPERPGFGIYEKPRFSLGSRRARMESMNSEPRDVARQQLSPSSLPTTPPQ